MDRFDRIVWIVWTVLRIFARKIGLQKLWLNHLCWINDIILESLNNYWCLSKCYIDFTSFFYSWFEFHLSEFHKFHGYRWKNTLVAATSLRYTPAKVKSRMHETEPCKSLLAAHEPPSNWRGRRRQWRHGGHRGGVCWTRKCMRMRYGIYDLL